MENIPDMDAVTSDFKRGHTQPRTARHRTGQGIRHQAGAGEQGRLPVQGLPLQTYDGLSLIFITGIPRDTGKTSLYWIDPQLGERASIARRSGRHPPTHIWKKGSNRIQLTHWYPNKHLSTLGQARVLIWTQPVRAINDDQDLKSSKPQDLYLELSDRCEIWQASRQRCWLVPFKFQSDGII